MQASLANLSKLLCLCGCLTIATGCEPEVETAGDESPAATGNSADLTPDPAPGTAAIDPNDAQTDVSIDLNRDSEDAVGTDGVNGRPRLRERIGDAIEGVDVNAGDGRVDVDVE